MQLTYDGKYWVQWEQDGQISLKSFTSRKDAIEYIREANRKVKTIQTSQKAR